MRATQTPLWLFFALFSVLVFIFGHFFRDELSVRTQFLAREKKTSKKHAGRLKKTVRSIMWCSTDDKHAKDRSKQIDKVPIFALKY